MRSHLFRGVFPLSPFLAPSWPLSSSENWVENSVIRGVQSSVLYYGGSPLGSPVFPSKVATG